MRASGSATRRALAAAGAFALAAAPTPPADAAPPPRRIVSLNPCLDAILMDVADPGQITALSRYSADPASFAFPERARPFRHVNGDGEELAALRPDLVLASGMGAASLGRALGRLHIRSQSFGVPKTLAESEAQVREVAALAGHPERGEEVVRRIEAAQAAARPGPGEPPLTALVFEGRGLASGPHTLMDQMMTLSGFRNMAPAYGLTRTADVPLERLLASPPRVLLAGRLQAGEPSWADRVLAHPALRSLRGRMLVESFPEPLLYCAGPVLVPAFAALASARRDAERPAP